MVTIVGKDLQYQKKVTCPDCSSILEYTQSEVERGRTTDYTGTSEYYYFISCPCCGGEVTVKGY